MSGRVIEGTWGQTGKAGARLKNSPCINPFQLPTVDSQAPTFIPHNAKLFSEIIKAWLLMTSSINIDFKRRARSQAQIHGVKQTSRAPTQRPGGLQYKAGSIDCFNGAAMEPPTRAPGVGPALAEPGRHG